MTDNEFPGRNACQSDRKHTANQFDLSVIIPAFNEENSVSGVIEGVDKIFSPTGIKVEIIVIDDGSSDATAAKASEALSNIQTSGIVYTLAANSGFGAAIREGILRSNGDWMVWTPGDGEFFAEDLMKMYESRGNNYFVVGKLPASEKLRTLGLLRSILSLSLAALIKTLYPQAPKSSGVGMIKNGLIEASRLRSSTGFINYEMLDQIIRQHGKRFSVVNISVSARKHGVSKTVNLKQIVRLAYECIRYRLCSIFRR